MAGFFGLFDYTKEGPGVYANEPPKGPFKTFLSILGRKFWKIITINMMYVVFSLPVFIAAILIGPQIISGFLPDSFIEVIEKIFSGAIIPEISGDVSQTVSSLVSSGVSGSAEAAPQLDPGGVLALLFYVISFSMIGLQLFVLGPVHAGISYLFRNYSREEHAFVWGDFIEHLKKNWKQSLITSIIGILTVFVLSINFSFYSKGTFITNTFAKGLLTGSVVVILLIFTMMQMYIYPMMITFKLTLKQIYKNSLLLTMARLPLNIGIMLLSLLITTFIPFVLVSVGGLGLVIGIFYYILLAFGLNLLLTNFFVYRQLKKYMIDPMVDKSSEESIDESVGNNDSDDSDANDDGV